MQYEFEVFLKNGKETQSILVMAENKNEAKESAKTTIKDDPAFDGFRITSAKRA